MCIFKLFAIFQKINALIKILGVLGVSYVSIIKYLRSLCVLAIRFKIIQSILQTSQYLIREKMYFQMSLCIQIYIWRKITLYILLATNCVKCIPRQINFLKWITSFMFVIFLQSMESTKYICTKIYSCVVYIP